MSGASVGRESKFEIDFYDFHYNIIDDISDDEEITSGGEDEFEKTINNFTKSNKVATITSSPSSSSRMNLTVQNTSSSAVSSKPLIDLPSFHGNRLTDKNGGGSCASLLPSSTPSVLFNLKQCARSSSPLATSGNTSRLHLKNPLVSSPSIYGGVDIDADDFGEEESGI